MVKERPIELGASQVSSTKNRRLALASRTHTDAGQEAPVRPAVFSILRQNTLLGELSD